MGVLHEQELLRFHGVGHVALVIDTAREVSAARHAPSALIAHLWRDLSPSPRPDTRAAGSTPAGSAPCAPGAHGSR